MFVNRGHHLRDECVEGMKRGCIKTSEAGENAPLDGTEVLRAVWCPPYRAVTRGMAADDTEEVVFASEDLRPLKRVILPVTVVSPHGHADMADEGLRDEVDVW